MNKLQIVSIFVLINILIIIFAGVLWIFPIGRSLRNGLTGVRVLERRSAVERVFAEDFEENKREYEEVLSSRLVLGYDEKLPALAEISRIAALHNLENSEMGASQSMVSDFGVHRFYETRVKAEYRGALRDVISFLREFSQSDGKIHAFSIFSDENARLQVEFSMYAVSGGV